MRVAGREFVAMGDSETAVRYFVALMAGSKDEEVPPGGAALGLRSSLDAARLCRMDRHATCSP